MSKPHILQLGPYPDWDQDPLDVASHSHWLDLAPDRAAFPAQVGSGIRAIAVLGIDGLLANISRAGTVDDALENHAPDVFEGEPNLDPRFLRIDSLPLQPHAAFATHQTRRAMGQLMRHNLTVHFAGEPPPTPIPLESS